MPTLLDALVAMLPLKRVVLLVSTCYYLFQHVLALLRQTCKKKMRAYLTTRHSPKSLCKE